MYFSIKKPQLACWKALEQCLASICEYERIVTNLIYFMGILRGCVSRFHLLLSIARPQYFAYSYNVPLAAKRDETPALSQLMQAEQGAARSTPAVAVFLPIWQAVLLFGLLSWLYFPTVTRLAAQWWHDPNFSHGFFVPLFAGFVLWQDRSRLAVIKPDPSWAGLPILAFGLAVLILGQLGAEIFLSRFSLLIVVAGLLVLFIGWNFFRAVLFPWAFLALMIPIPSIIFSQITFPLQILASRLAAVALSVFGVPVLRQGNVIMLPAMALEVADACSGIRSLMSLVTLAIIYGYLMDRSIRLRMLLALAAIPIAIAANSFRILGAGLLVQYWDPDKAEGFFHGFQGWIMFVVSLAMLYFFRWFLHAVWPEQRVAS